MNFERSLYHQLVKWKNGKYRKPLVLEGARQVGKTTLVNYFGQKEFIDTAYFNFEENEDIKKIFLNTKDIKRIISNLSIIHGKQIKHETTLLFFDEIQECNEALNTLKYFREKEPNYAVIAAGSLLGITLGQKSFPVGNVEFLKLYPLSFSEYLKNRDTRLHDLLKNFRSVEPMLDIFHHELIEQFKSYLICGGMPEAAKYMIGDIDIYEVQKSLDQIHNSYAKDFAKHAEKNESIKLRYIWESIASQLSRENKKFVYQVVKPGARAREYESAIQWLHDAGLIYKVNLCTKPFLPLKAYKDLLAFKIYMLDIGLLRRQAGLDPSAILEGNRLFTEFKGAISENYILQSLILQFESTPFYWTSKSDAEIDFIIQYKNDIIPIEVKSSENTRSKSLAYFNNEFSPKIRIRYSLKNLAYSDGLLSIPIYLADQTKQLIDTILHL